MLYNIVLSVILLAFLFSLILEIIIGYILIKREVVNKRKETIKMPKLKKPSRAERKKKTEEMKKFEMLLNNIDTYDGTTFGQKDLE